MTQEYEMTVPRPQIFYDNMNLMGKNFIKTRQPSQHSISQGMTDIFHVFRAVFDLRKLPDDQFISLPIEEGDDRLKVMYESWKVTYTYDIKMCQLFLLSPRDRIEDPHNLLNHPGEMGVKHRKAHRPALMNAGEASPNCYEHNVDI